MPHFDKNAEIGQFFLKKIWILSQYLNPRLRRGLVAVSGDGRALQQILKSASSADAGRKPAPVVRRMSRAASLRGALLRNPTVRMRVLPVKYAGLSRASGKGRRK